MSRLAFALVSTAWIASAAAVLAQEPPSGPPSWTGEGGLSFVQNSGNSETSTFGATLKLFHEEGPWKIGVSGGYLRSSDSDVKTAERIDGLLRAERGFGERFGAYGQLGYLRNQFAGIDGNETLESGGLYKLAVGPKHFLSASAALAYTWEQRLPPAADRDFAGGRFAIAYKWQISPSADLTQDLDYLQSFKDSGDGRLTSKTALTAAINQVFAIKLGDALFFYNDPVPGKKKTDNTIYASIVARWPAPAPPAPPCPPAPPPPPPAK
jgi:putative salt-induced outer membrane protein YdiY